MKAVRTLRLGLCPAIRRSDCARLYSGLSRRARQSVRPVQASMVGLCAPPRLRPVGGDRGVDFVQRQPHLLPNLRPTVFLRRIAGLLTGMGYLDLGIFLHGPMGVPLQTRIAMNVPHIVIGGFAILVRLRARQARPRTLADRVKRRWKILLGTGGRAARAALVPIITIETQCRAPDRGAPMTQGYTPLAQGRRLAARRIAHLADLSRMAYRLFGGKLRAVPEDAPAERIPLCRATSGASGRLLRDEPGLCGPRRRRRSDDALHYRTEPLGRADGESAYENALGRLSELIGGWKCADDRLCDAGPATLRRLHARDAVVRIPVRPSVLRPVAHLGAAREVPPLGAPVGA